MAGFWLLAVHVFPACAGMSPWLQLPPWWLGCFPRMRGDEPTTVQVPLLW